MSAAEREARVLAALEAVRLSPAAELVTRYPHTLSGGQRQRVSHRPGDDPGARLPGRRRAGVDDRRVEPRGDPGAAARSPADARPDDAVDHARPRERAPLGRPDRGDVRRARGGGGRRRGRSCATRATPTRRRCWPPSRSPIPRTACGRVPWSAGSRPVARRPAAAAARSGPAAPSPSRASARSPTRRSWRAPAAAWSPATTSRARGRGHVRMA